MSRDRHPTAEIVPLDPGRRRNDGAAPDLALPNVPGLRTGVLRRLHGEFRRALTDLLEEMFNGADDTLFELAEKAVVDSEQQRYFDAMRALRLERARIHTDHARAFDRAVETAVAGGPAGPGPGPDLEAVGLVDHDTMEIEVAVSGMASKLRTRCPVQFQQFHRRTGELLGRPELREDGNPFGPAALGRSFAAALEPLETDIQIRLVLLKLYEHTVIEQLPPLYERANRQLVEAGLLPDGQALLRQRTGRPGSSGSPRSVPAPSESPGSPAGPVPSSGSGTDGVTWDALAFAGGRLPGGDVAALLQPFRSGAGPATPGGPGAPDPTPRSSGGSLDASGCGPGGLAAPVYDQLQALQHQHALAGENLLSPVAPLDPQTVISRLSATAPLSGGHQDAVNLVGMLFDYILNDRNLAIPMKALIGRLQFPILKVALLDRSFFSRTDHPARLLLNELASAGIGWSRASELRRNETYDHIERIVKAVLTEFDQDLEVFPRLLAEFREHLRGVETRRAQLEQRLRDAESGRERNRAAQQAAEAELACLSTACRTALGGAFGDWWLRVLRFVHLREGEESPDWADQLAWLAAVDGAPVADRETAERLVAEARSCLARVHCDQDTGQGILRRLLHWLLTGEPARDADSRHPAADARSGATRGRREPEGNATRDAAEPRNGPIRERIALDGGPDSPDAGPATPESKDPEAARAAVPGPAAPDSGAPPAPKALEALGRLHEGQWLELPGALCARPVPEPVRARLVTVLGARERFVFTNERGMKIAEVTGADLGDALLAGRAITLDDAQLFDRALAAVIGHLRERRTA